MSLGIRLLFLIWMTILATPSYASDPNLRAPPGFEDLSGPRSTIVNLYHLGRDYGTVAITIEGSRFRFVDAEKVAAKLPLDRSSSAMGNFSGWHEANLAKVCGRMAANGCGSLRTDGIAFILDEAQFRLDIFVSAALLRQDEDGEFIEPTHSGLSFVSNVAASLAGTLRQSDLYVENDSIVALGSARARVVTSMVAGKSPFTHEATIELDRANRRFKGGLFWTSTTSFLGRQRIVGAGVQSQFDTMSDRESMLGTPLEVVLSERARIDVFDGDRLLSTGFYEIGLASVDTRNFPQGAYSLRIVVTGAGGRTREEERFFNKSLSLPPSGETAFYAFAGLMNDGSAERSRFTKPILTAGVQKRLDEQLALSASLVATQKTSLAEVAVNFATEQAVVRNAAMFGIDGEAGLSTSINFRPLERLAFDFGARASWTKDGQDVFYSEEQERQTPEGSAGFPLPTSNYSQLLASASASIGRGSLRIHGSYVTSGRQQSSSSVGAVVDYPLMTGRHGTLAVTASALKSNGTFSSFAGIRLFKSLGQGAITGRVGVANRDARASDREQGVVGDVSFSRHTSVGKTILSGTAGYTRDLYSDDARLGLEAIAPRFTSRAEFIQNIAGQGGSSQYAASIRTGIGLSRGAAILGGNKTASSAVSVSVGGNDDTELEIYVDGQSVGTATAGRPLTAFLQPYRKYEISARPSGASQMHIDAPRREITLFPGGVVPVQFITTDEYVVFGKLVDRFGIPQVGRVLRTSRNVAQSDDHGYFQLNVVGDEVVHLDRDDGPMCVIPAVEKGRGPLKKIGDLVCQSQQN